MTTKSTLCAARTSRMSSALKTRSGGCILLRARLRTRDCELGPKAVELNAAGQAGFRRHRALAHQVVHVVAAAQPLAAEYRLVAHRGEDRCEALPGDVLLAALDPRDRALARARAIGEFALA